MGRNDSGAITFFEHGGSFTITQFKFRLRGSGHTSKVVSGIVSASTLIYREIDLEEGANWFLLLATCLDLIHSNKDGKLITKYTDHFHNNLG